MAEEQELQDMQEARAPMREVLTWKQKAMRLYESRQTAREQQQQMFKSKHVDQFREALGSLLGKEYEIEDMRTEIDGVTFIGHAAQGQGTACEVDIEFTCPDCGGVRTQRVRGLADIGAVLSGAPDTHTNCPAKAQQATGEQEIGADQKLIQALRDFLASELEQA